jgi:hypothetical protein
VWTFFFIVVSLFEGSVIAFLAYHMFRWAKIIFMLEDDLTEAIEVHERTEKTLENIRKTPLFTDNIQIKAQLDEAMEQVKVCQTATHRLVYHLTQRSKQKRTF